MANHFAFNDNFASHRTIFRFTQHDIATSQTTTLLCLDHREHPLMAQSMLNTVLAGKTDVLLARVPIERGTAAGNVGTTRHPADRISFADWPSILAAIPAVKGETHLVLPAESALLRVMELPSTDPAEIGSMVELQLDQLAPFSSDLMLTSWELLAQSDARSRVLMTALRSQDAEAVGAAAQSRPIEAHRIDLDLPVLYHLLRKKGRIPDQGRHLVITTFRSVCWMIIVELGSPIFIRHLGAMPAPDTGSTWADIAEEVEFAFTELESEWGTASIGSCTVWAEKGSILRDHLAPLASRLGISVSMEDLPDLTEMVTSAAERALPGGPQRLNLAPPAWRDSFVEKAQRRTFMRAGIAVLAVWFCLLAVGAALLEFRRAEVSTLLSRSESLKAPAEEARRLQDELAFLTAFTNRTESVLECMREYNLVLPDNQSLVMTDFVYRKDAGLTLRGKGPQNEVFSFTDRLGQSALLDLGEIEYVNGRFTVNAVFSSQKGAP